MKSIELTFRPLSKWPGKATPSTSRQRARFTAKYRDTMDLLDRELHQLRAKSVVIQLDCDEREIRRDGLPRSDARTRGPGVVLSFESAKGSLSFPCDRFTNREDNLRAIALALEALRTVDRYGVTQNAEQYRGWAALPDHSQRGPFADRHAAMVWLGSSLGVLIRGWPWGDEYRALVRRKAMAESWPPKNVIIGTSIEDQKRAAERFPAICELGEAGWRTMVSIEPLLGAVVIPERYLALGKRAWVIVGGESGNGARPMHPQWARDIRNQCNAARVPFFFKQFGEFVPRDSGAKVGAGGCVIGIDGREKFPGDMNLPEFGFVSLAKVGKGAAGRILDGRTWDEFPAV